MSKVKIDLPKVHDIELAAYNPVSRKWRNAVLVVMFFGCAYLFYWLGSNGYHLPAFTEKIEVASIRAELDKEQELNKALREEVARLTSSTEVELLVAKQTKATLHEKELQILKLTEELGFYRSLLAPEIAKLGLEVRDFSVRSSPENGEFYYDLLLTQSSRNKTVAKGKVSLMIDGKQDGVMRRLDLKDIVEDPFESIQYSFKYFQRLNGVFALPSNFEPQQLVLELDPASGSKQALQVSYSWGELVRGS